MKMASRFWHPRATGPIVLMLLVVLVYATPSLSAEFTVTHTTDDGSQGNPGLVTEGLEKALDAGPVDLICACGPHGMLKAVAIIAMQHRIACQVSIEAMMACGMGACLGCAVALTDDDTRYRHVCVDGPVFEAHRLDW